MKIYNTTFVILIFVIMQFRKIGRSTQILTPLHITNNFTMSHFFHNRI